MGIKLISILTILLLSCNAKKQRETVLIEYNSGKIILHNCSLPYATYKDSSSYKIEFSSYTKFGEIQRLDNTDTIHYYTWKNPSFSKIISDTSGKYSIWLSCYKTLSNEGGFRIQVVDKESYRINKGQGVYIQLETKEFYKDSLLFFQQFEKLNIKDRTTDYLFSINVSDNMSCKTFKNIVHESIDTGNLFKDFEYLLDDSFDVK